MRTVRNYSLEEESPEEQSEAGRHHPALVMRYRDKRGKHRVTLATGQSDDVAVYREGEITYVLSVNRMMGYVGLEAFVGDEQTGNFFLQHDHEVESVLGKKGLDLEDLTIARRLAEFIE